MDFEKIAKLIYGLYMIYLVIILSKFNSKKKPLSYEKMKIHVLICKILGLIYLGFVSISLITIIINFFTQYQFSTFQIGLKNFILLFIIILFYTAVISPLLCTIYLILNIAKNKKKSEDEAKKDAPPGVH